MSIISVCVWFSIVLVATLVTLGLLSVFSRHPASYNDNDDFPKSTIEAFYVPALNIGSNDATNQTINTTVSFDLRVKIEYNNIMNPVWGVYYDTFDLTLYYYHNNSRTTTTGGIYHDTLIRLPVGNISISKFFQPKFEEPKHHLVNVQTFGVPWEEAKIAVSNDGITTFGLELASDIMYMSKDGDSLWPMTVRFGANVTVNDRGTKSVHRADRLTSASRRFNNPSSFIILALPVLGFIL